MSLYRLSTQISSWFPSSCGSVLLFSTLSDGLPGLCAARKGCLVIAKRMGGVEKSLLTRMAVIVSNKSIISRRREEMMSGLPLLCGIGRASFVVTFDMFSGAEQGGQRSLVFETGSA